MSNIRCFTIIPAPARLIIGAGLLLGVAALDTARAQSRAVTPNAEISVFEIMAEDAETLAISAEDQNLWIYGKQRLQAFQRDGRPVLDRKLPQLPSTSHAVDMLVGNQTVWLAIGNELYRINLQGRLVTERRFRGSIRAIHYDAKKSQVLVTMPHHVIVLDNEGREVTRIRTRLPHIA